MNTNTATLQDDILAYLQCVPALAQVALVAVKPRDLQSQVNEALAGVKLTNGKSGAAIEISKPFKVDPMPEAPGPVSYVEVRFVIKVNPAINNGAHGAGLAVEEISDALVQAMHEWGPEGSASGSFFPSNDFDSPATFTGDDGKPLALEGRFVKMRARLVLTPPPRTAAPEPSETSLLVSLTNTDPDPDAIMLYTTNGLAPRCEQGTTTPDSASGAVLYAAPFTVETGAVVRAVAISAGKLPSNIITFTVNQ